MPSGFSPMSCTGETPAGWPLCRLRCLPGPSRSACRGLSLVSSRAGWILPWILSNHPVPGRECGQRFGSWPPRCCRSDHRVCSAGDHLWCLKHMHLGEYFTTESVIHLKRMWCELVKFAAKVWNNSTNLILAESVTHLKKKWIGKRCRSLQIIR